MNPVWNRQLNYGLLFRVDSGSDDTRKKKIKILTSEEIPDVLLEHEVQTEAPGPRLRHGPQEHLVTVWRRSRSDMMET